MLTVSELSKSFGGRILFEEAALQINRGDRIALVGPNGAGKSTLFLILLGIEEADAGRVAMQRGVRVGFLPQETVPVNDETVLQLATTTLRDAESDNHDALDEESFESNDLQQLEAKAKRILRGLSFRETDFARQARTMSGGWIMRAHLARLLVTEPDLLLLDEPTNHLDLESVVWLQNYLTGYPGAILMISHDRAFLNALAERIIEIDQRKLAAYRGNYDDYVAQKAARQELALAAFKNQQREIKHLQTFIDRFGAKNTKASQAQSKRKQIERMDKLEAPEMRNRNLAFRFPQPERSGRKVIELRDIHHAYGETVVYRGTDLTIERNQRTVFVGPNGSGKSTLLKLLGGVLPVQRGVRVLGHNVQVGYCSQNRADTLNLDRTVLEETADCGATVKVLSGGEKSRLVLAKLLINPPNFLLMDEPTTHLDMASIEALVEALRQYEGTLVFISHDVYFIQSIATSVLHVRGGQLTFYPGDYDYYLHKTGTDSAVAGLVADDKPAPAESAGSAAKAKDQKRIDAEERQRRSQARQKFARELSSIESKILELELRQKELATFLEQSSDSSVRLTPAQVSRELASVTQELHTLSREWERMVDQTEI